MHFGQSESVSRGHPRGGFGFSQLLSRGFSDHFGVKEGLGFTRLHASNTCQTAFAVTVTAFSTYLIGLCISFAVAFPLRSRSTRLWYDASNALSVVRLTPVESKKVLNCGDWRLTGEYPT